MPYKKRKKKCKQSDGTPGSYVLSYTTKKGEKRSACHTSQKKMQGQIAAIEAESDNKGLDEDVIDMVIKYFVEGVSTDAKISAKTFESRNKAVANYLISELLQSHTEEPEVGDYVTNVNPGCKHYGSKGVVVKLENLPDDVGTAACYVCTNSGETWGIGDVLTKSLDQLEFS